MTDIQLTLSQQKALQQMEAFVHSSERCFILTGYAGTGKTTLMHTLIQYLNEQNIRYNLLSSTGRAAKILSNYTGEEASTIHHLIYSYSGFNQDLSDAKEDVTVDEVGQLYLDFGLSSCDEEDADATIYIIDEASMVADTGETLITQARFGSGRLLKDLFDYDQRPNAKYIFVGDPCQLPPISESISPALSPLYLMSKFHYFARKVMLTEIMRQSDESSIIRAADAIRKLWSNAPDTDEHYPVKVWGKLLFSRYSDIRLLLSTEAMICKYVDTIQQHGYDASTLICQSNKDCNSMAREVRSRLGFSGSVQPHDLLLVTQNQLTIGLMNGDMVEVVSVNRSHERIMLDTPHHYRSELYFVEVTVKELFSQRTYTTLLLESLLNSTMPNLDSRQQTGLFLDFIMRMKRKDITQKKHKEQFDKAMQTDPYLNALRCSYGYAITCHKAQGGEWDSVFIIPQRNIMLNPTKAKYQWLYTALTRARKTVYFVRDFYIQ